MPLMVIVFGGIPAFYGIIYSLSEIQFHIYIYTLMSLICGFVIVRSICKRAPCFLINIERGLKRRLARRLILVLLGAMVLSSAIAINGILNTGLEYRQAFFVSQDDIFGYDRFGFFFQLLTEFSGIAIFSILLTREPKSEWLACLFIWVTLGTLVTLGRWYIAYAVLLLIFTSHLSIKRLLSLKILLYALLSIFVTAVVSLIFVCRGAECDFSPEMLIHGFVSGVLNYFFIPIEMVNEYQRNQDYGINLLFGFFVYPFNIVSRLTGIYDLAYEYDQWALLIQDYVQLESVGYYNALVGQPLTSYVAAGYAGIVLHYFLIGALMGVSYFNSQDHHPIAVIAGVIGAVSFLIPALSGPALVFTLGSYWILNKILFNKNRLVC